MQVSPSLSCDACFWFLSILWWAHVTDTPERSKIAVFSKGTENASIVLIPTGGQTMPISAVGAKEEWKNAQKKEKKKSTSLTIKRSIPIFRPSTTKEVWCPWKADSRDTSRHHIVAIKAIKATVRKKGVNSFLLITLISATGIDIMVNPLNKGQGEYSTKWKGWEALYRSDPKRI